MQKEKYRDAGRKCEMKSISTIYMLTNYLFLADKRKSTMYYKFVGCLVDGCWAPITGIERAGWREVGCVDFSA